MDHSIVAQLDASILRVCKRASLVEEASVKGYLGLFDDTKVKELSVWLSSVIRVLVRKPVRIVLLEALG